MRIAKARRRIADSERLRAVARAQLQAIAEIRQRRAMPTTPIEQSLDADRPPG